MQSALGSDCLQDHRHLLADAFVPFLWTWAGLSAVSQEMLNWVLCLTVQPLNINRLAGLGLAASAINPVIQVFFTLPLCPDLRSGISPRCLQFKAWIDMSIHPCVILLLFFFSLWKGLSCLMFTGLGLSWPKKTIPIVWEMLRDSKWRDGKAFFPAMSLHSCSNRFLIVGQSRSTTSGEDAEL